MASAEYVVERALAKFDLKQVVKEFLQTLVREQLVLTQIGCCCVYAIAVLYGLRHLRRKLGLHASATMGAGFDLCAMLCDANVNLWKVEDLACFMLSRCVL